jgi:hypothetical protein
MKKLLLLVLLASTAIADERVLVVPAQEYTDGRNYPEYIRYFKDDIANEAHVKCMEYARWLHSSRISAPNYSMCVDPVEIFGAM